MDLQFNGTYIKARVVYSAMVTPKTEKVVSKEATFWKKAEYKEVKTWVLAVEYLSENGQTYKFTSEHSDYNFVNDAFKEVMKQIKDQDSSYADKLLEDAIIGGGKDPK